MRQPGDGHQINIGNLGPAVANTATETQTVKILHDVTPEAIATAFEPAFDSIGRLEGLVREAQSVTSIHAPWQQTGGYLVEAGRSVRDNYPPDVGVLYKVLTLLDGITLIAYMPEPFAKMVGDANASPRFLIDHGIALQVGAQTQQPLLIAVQAAFVPRERRDRDMPQVEAWHGLIREPDYNYIVRMAPDLSDLATPAERLRAVIGMLVPPTADQARARHTAALEQLCAAEGITSLEDTKASDLVRYKLLHQRAGAAALAGNLFAILLNPHHQGLLNRSVFDADEGEGSLPRTERGKCPAIPLVSSYLHGVGLLLARHFDDVLALMERAAASEGGQNAAN